MGRGKEYLNKILEKHGESAKFTPFYCNVKHKDTYFLMSCPIHGDKILNYRVIINSEIPCCWCRKFKENLDYVHSKFPDQSFNILKHRYHFSETVFEVNCKEHGLTSMNGRRLIEKPIHCKKCLKAISVENTKGSLGFSKSSFLKTCRDNGKEEVILYLLRCFNNEEVFVKIGLTTRSIQERFHGKREMPYNYEVLNSFKLSPEKCWDSERKLVKRLKEFRYKPRIKFGGSSKECFEDCFEVYNIIEDEGFEIGKKFK